MEATIERMKIEVLLDGKKTFVGLKELQKRLNIVQKTGKKLSSAFKPFLKLAGIAGFAKMAIDAGHFGRQMGLLADKTGIAASKLSSMRNAFSAVGGKAESVDNLINNITTGLARLSMGDGAMASKLSAMGISAWDESGNVKSADVVTGDLADWAKSQLAMGRSMAEVSTYLHDNFGIEQDLVNELALGRAGMEKARRDTERKAGSVGESTIANLESLNRSFALLKTTIGVLTDKIIAGLSPVIEFFTDLLQILFRGLQDVWKEVEIVFGEIFGNGKEISILFGFLKDVIGGLVDALKIAVDVIGFVFGIIKSIGEAIGEIVAGIVIAISETINAIKSVFDWFKNSWLGKKIFGGDEDEKEEQKATELLPHKEKLKLPIIGEKEETPIIYMGMEGYVDEAEEKPVMPVLFQNADGSSNFDLSKTNSRGETTININVDSKQDISGGNPQQMAQAVEGSSQEQADMIGESVYNVMNGGK